MDFQIPSGADAINGATHHLGLDAQTVDRPTDIDHADAAFDAVAAIGGHRHFHRVRGVATKGEMCCQTDATTRLESSSPADALGGPPQHLTETPGLEDRAAVT